MSMKFSHYLEVLTPGPGSFCQENMLVVVVETSYQVLEVLSFCDL